MARTLRKNSSIWNCSSRSVPTTDSATWWPTPAAACAASRLRVEVFKASAPAGDWQLELEDTPVVRNLFTDGVVQDIVVVFALFIGDQRAAGSSNTLE